MNDIENVGEVIELQGNNPFLIDTGDYIWIVKEGKVNLYAVFLNDKEILGVRNYICTIFEGENFFGQKADEKFGYPCNW